MEREEGYRVRYSDGYERWFPKDVFESKYRVFHRAVQVVQEFGIRAPSISQEMVDDFIREVEVTTMGDRTTVVRAVLRNGFVLVESSSCVSAENYDEQLGADICLSHIKDKVWMLLDFLLQTAVHGI